MNLELQWNNTNNKNVPKNECNKYCKHNLSISQICCDDLLIIDRVYVWLTMSFRECWYLVDIIGVDASVEAHVEVI